MIGLDRLMSAPGHVCVLSYPTVPMFFVQDIYTFALFTFLIRRAPPAAVHLAAATSFVPRIVALYARDDQLDTVNLYHQ